MIKFQITNNKSQINSNDQISNVRNCFGHWKIGIWILFVIWCLGFGISNCYAEDAAQVFLLDDFEKAGNLVGGKSNTYEKEPSKSLAMRVSEEFYGNAGRSLMIKFDKKSEGGLYGTGGWCGYYTMLRSGAKYFDITPYKTLTFQVKGAKGGENFKIGLADRHWEELGDSVKSEDVVKYIPTGKITTEWQKAVVPLDVFFLDKKEVSSLAFCFESESFATGSAKGTVYIDDLKLE